MVDSVQLMTFLGLACVKAALSRWWLLFHLSVCVWESMTVTAGNGGKSMLWMHTQDDKQITFFILSFILTLNLGLHSYTHSTSTTHPCPDINWIHKSRVPSSLGIVRHNPVKSAFGLVWACWIIVGLGCALQSFMFAHWWGNSWWAVDSELLVRVSSFDRWEASELFKH